MCRKYIRLLALMIVLTMSLSSCKLLFNIDKVRETNHMKNYYGTINGGVFYTDISLLPSVFIHALAVSNDEETEEERNAREFVEGANKLKEEEGKTQDSYFI